MKIAIVGASGLVGSSLMEDISPGIGKGCQVIGTYHQHAFGGGVHLNITDREEIRKFIASYLPDVLIWLAGSKELALLEKKPELSRALNEQPIADLAEILRTGHFATKVIYVSSDYVFDGNRGGYTVGDIRAPDTIYGRSKVYAEDLLAASGIDCVSLRTSAIMNAKGGFFGWLLGQIKGGRDINLYANTIFSPTSSISFNRAIVRIIQEALWGGVLHFAGIGMSRYHFGRKIAGLLLEDVHRISPATADIAHSTFHSNFSLVTSGELHDLIPGDAELLLELSRYDQICR